MKKALIVFALPIFLLACHSTTKKENSSPSAPAAAIETEHTDVAAGLILNNGAKWKADTITLTNVALLQAIVANSKDKTLENYLQSSAGLQDGLNKMVSECKMKGAEHEALHHWLEPIMEKTNALKNANSIETARTIFGGIEKQINLFPQYFE